jgi:hypothetical protein
MATFRGENDYEPNNVALRRPSYAQASTTLLPCACGDCCNCQGVIVNYE